MADIPVPPSPSFLKKWGTRLMVMVGVMTTIFVVLAVVGLASKKHQTSEKGNVAHVKLQGVIVSTSERSAWFDDPGVVSADEILETLEEIAKDPHIKGILFEINSPGGTPVASQDIAEAVHALKIPTVAWIREVGASGAYWVASACSRIVASPLSITGSIGVLANNFGFEDALQAFHIRYRRQVAGSMKDIGDPFRAPTENETQYLQHVLDQIHQKFIQEVGINRKFDGDWAKDVANGVFFTGEDALAHKLVDQLGSKKEALEWLRHTLKEPIELVDFDNASPLLKWLHGEVRVLAQEFVNAVGVCLLRSQPTIRT